MTSVRTKIFIAASLAVLCFFNVSIFQKEQIRKNGETVLLELAPADPRSLMQGDYMRLNYKIGAGIPALSEVPAEGRIVIAAGPDHVGYFVRDDDGAPLKDGEKRLRYRHDHGTVIVPNSFMFQEGNADVYRRAKYGVFKFDGPDHYLLVGLADESRKQIEAPDRPLNFDANPR